MTSTEGAALAQLRDLYYILTHDLAYAQLDDMATASKNAQESPTGSAAQVQAAAQISPIVSRLAPTVVLFSNAVELADKLTQRSVTSAFFLIILIWVLISLVGVTTIGVTGNMLWRGYRAHTLAFEVAAPFIGKIVLAALASISFLVAWLLMVHAHRDNMNHNSDVLKVGYWHVHNVLGGSYAIRFANAVQSGTLQDFVQQPYHSGGSTLTPGSDCEDDNEVTDAQPCAAQINPCTSEVPSLDKVIWMSCKNEIFNMLTKLHEIKTEGIDKYDRVAMWDTISAGVEVIRGTVEVSADADTSTPAQVVVLPATTGTGVSTPGKPAVPAYTSPQGHKIPAVPAVPAYTSPQGLQIPAVPAVPADIIYQIPAVPAVPAVGVQSTAPLDVIKSFDPILHSLGVSDIASTLADEPGTPSAADMVVRKSLTSWFDRMASQMLPLITVLPYKLNLNDYRTELEAPMIAYYGAYYPKIRFELLSVLSQVQKALDAVPPTGAIIYVDAQTMVARIASMGPSAWREVVSGTALTQQTVHSFLTNFKLPHDQPSPATKITRMMCVLLIIAGFVGLLMYVINVMFDLLALRLDSQSAARRILYASFLYALVTVVGSSMVDRMKYRSDHNWAALKKNGQTLNFALTSVEVTGSAIENSAQVIPTQAQSYIDASTATMQAYDACNSVTNGASTMPFPTMELVIYAAVVVVVVSSALYGVAELNPSEKLANIRTLLHLREQVVNGVTPGGLAKQLECCRPKQSMWQIMMWLSLLVLFCLNIFVMANVQKGNQNYSQSLITQATCV